MGPNRRLILLCIGIIGTFWSYFHLNIQSIQSVHPTVNVGNSGVRIFDLGSPLKDEEAAIFCLKSKELRVSVTLCLHDIDKDIYISNSIRMHGIWEEPIVDSFVRILEKYPDALVIDVGAQIGQYSLFAAKLGHRVLTIEPFIDNIYRLHKAARIESLHREITVIQNAVSNQRNEVKLLHESPDNVGGQSLLPNKDKTYTFDDKMRTNNKYFVETILLDDIVQYLPKKSDGNPHSKAIMKIDIEGFEPYALQNASKLFDTLNIQIIFMEWGVLKKSTSLHKLVKEMIEFLHSRQYAPLSIRGNYLRLTYWQKWPWDIMWARRY